MSQPNAELDNAGDDSAMSLLMNRPDPAKGASAPEEEEEEDQLAEEEESDDPEQPETVDEEDPEEEWESGGEKFKVKKSELRAGYMKDADYRRKTAEVADQRRMVETFAQQLAQERQQAANQLDVFLGALHRDLIGSQPDPKLIEEDPQEFLRQQSAYQVRVQQFQGALAQRQAVQQRDTAEQQRQQAEYQRKQDQKLVEAIPAWKDSKVRTQESADIAVYLQSLGYTPQELNDLNDHRAMLVARDAAKYRQLQAAKGKQVPPAAGKPVKPGAARPGSSSQTRYDDALAKARKTGRPEDVVRVLMQKG